MTCQWCVHYRRRGGQALCVRPGGDGNIMPRKGRSEDCVSFSPRRSCTTCERRCSISDRAEMTADGGKCPEWKLREVESWGGYRKTPDWRTRLLNKNKNKEKGGNMKAMAVAAALVAGCTGTVTVPEQGSDVPRDTNATYLCVGMENSARFGACPGCAKDAMGIASLLSDRYGYPGVTLISEKATKSAVVRELREGVDSTPEGGLFIFCYSGHGGQEWFGGVEPDGADSPDEYLCLYDLHMLDDEIWDIVSRCKGRVFMYFDACHSATMYRSVASSMKPRSRLKGEAMSIDLVRSKGFSMDVEKYVAGRALGVENAPVPGILCWSGCKESEFSYGSSSGGIMTSALLRNWRRGKSYDTLWEDIVCRVQSSEPSQHPVQTKAGEGFGSGTEAFR